MKRILMLLGTRPEVVKMAPVFHSLQNSLNCKPILCVTGQHDAMLHQTLSAFEIAPEFNLEVMRVGQTLSDLTRSILKGTTELIDDLKPDSVLVHGDTTTAFAGALASFYKEVKVGHVEAGLRTHDLAAPFPEEANRQLIARIARLNFAPSSTSAANLNKEGVNHNSIFITGNTVVDSLKFISHRLETDVIFRDSTIAALREKTGIDVTSQKIVVVTAHRRENLGSGILEICRALVSLSQRHSDTAFIFPVHPNPIIREMVQRELVGQSGVYLTDPLPYPELIFALINSIVILTDSGGLQEEGVTLGKPVMVLRDKTERAEGAASGLLKVVGTNANVIVKEFDRMASSSTSFLGTRAFNSTYGDGEASRRITEVLVSGKTEEWVSPRP